MFEANIFQIVSGENNKGPKIVSRETLIHEGELAMQAVTKWTFNPFTPMSDQDKIFSYIIHTIREK